MWGIIRNHIQLLLARDADLALEGCGVVCAAWLTIKRGSGTPGNVGTYRSPAASEGKELNKSGCLGRGDSLEMDHISIQTNESNVQNDTQNKGVQALPAHLFSGLGRR